MLQFLDAREILVTHLNMGNETKQRFTTRNEHTSICGCGIDHKMVVHTLITGDEVSLSFAAKRYVNIYNDSVADANLYNGVGSRQHPLGVAGFTFV